MPKTVVVAGAGVVGLSVARAVARRAGMEVVVLEANMRVGMETSARNSEVIHGIYYPKNSLKARLCVRGRDLLYDYCETHSVSHKRCGKLIVAQAHQVDQLRPIAQRGMDNGVSDLRMISKEAAQRLEPEVRCDQALFSPSTGIVDSHALMQTLQGDAEDHGAAFAFATRVDSIESSPRAQTVKLTASSVATGETYEMECDYFINATGIFAPRLVKTSQQARPEITDRFAKGTYFKLRDNSRPFSHLVYPIPEVGGLGIHSTVDLDGNVRFGPDVEWVSSIDYTPDETKAKIFADRIREYWPRVTSENLYADYCGIRPKITMDGAIFDDFYIAGEKTHGMKGVIHLCGIESPGLTSSLAIADAVLALLNE